MEYALGDLLDRKGILQLKIELGHPTEWQRHNMEKELSAVNKALKDFSPKDMINYYCALIKSSNEKIWLLEWEIRQGLENELCTDSVKNIKHDELLKLAEIGRRALLIRENNKKRVELKNAVNFKWKSGFKEFKRKHASEVSQNDY